MVYVNIPQQQYPIYNTSQGAKMILSHQISDEARVYHLPGTLGTAIAEVNNSLIAQSSISNAYPNPANNTTRLDFKLPDGTKQGTIVFNDLQGKKVKSFKVDKTFDSLLISTSDIHAGTYYYQLQTVSDNSQGKSIVVIK